MNGVDGDDTAFAQAGECGDRHVSAGRKGYGAVRLGGRLMGFSAEPSGAQGCSQLAMGSAAGRDIHFAFPRTQDGDRQMCRRAKAEESNAIAGFYASHSQTAEANDSSAE